MLWIKESKSDPLKRISAWRRSTSVRRIANTSESSRYCFQCAARHSALISPVHSSVMSFFSRSVVYVMGIQNWLNGSKLGGYPEPRQGALRRPTYPAQVSQLERWVERCRWRGVVMDHCRESWA